MVAGILAGIFVFEITTPAGIQWDSFYRAKSFYLILALGVIVYFYNRALYSRDRDVLRFADSEYCVAYMRSKCLPEAVERYRTAIRLGNSTELDEAKKELRRVLK